MPLQDRHKAACLKAAKKAIKEMGGVSSASRALGIATSTISDWSWRGIPERHLDAVSIASGMPIEKLRPDIAAIRKRCESLNNAASRKEKTQKCNAQSTADQPCNASAPASACDASQ